MPAALKPPTSVAAAPVPGALAIRVSWVAAADAQATLIEFCRGSTCTNFASPVCRTSGPYDHALPAGATARYRLRSSRSPTCSADLSPAAGIVNATVPVITVPRTGTALISWTPVPRNTDGSALTNLAGYRIVYGTTAEALTRVTQVSSQLTSYTVESLPSGETWYFALKAYNSDGVESDLSRVVSKVIP